MIWTLEILREHYDSVWCVDFEYNTGISGADAPSPICMVARELFSGKTVRKWLWGGAMATCPIPTNERCLYVAFYASAEITCHLGLGWPVPTRILDLYAEFRCIANSKVGFQIASVEGNSKGASRFDLLNCMRTFGLGAEAVTAGYKDEARQLCIQGGPFSEADKTLILEYCESDVIALVKLLPRMLEFIDPHPALFRGRYMAAVAAMERRGIPVNKELADRLRDRWDAIVHLLITNSKCDFDVIGNKDIDQKKFAIWLESNGLLHSWPHNFSNSNSLRSDSNTLSDWAKFFPQVMRLKEFLEVVRRTRLFDKLQIGSDGRNRFLISPFGSKTGRNQPSNAKSVFGPACWVRLLIQPPPGYALIYCDWSGQEYGEAAYFSGDHKMIADYAKYRSQYHVSIEDFAEQVNDYIERESSGFRLNFYVDEVGQYIAENVKLMTNLQTIAESLATKCRGRAWVIVTAQEDMGTVVGEMGKQQSNDFSKIQARFANRMKLTSADVAEVIQKRLLMKNEDGVRQLTDIYHEQSNNFKTLFDFADGSQTYRNFQDRDHFIHSYPFIPYQFALFQSTIQNLSQHNAFEGTHTLVWNSASSEFVSPCCSAADTLIGIQATFPILALFTKLGH